MKKFFYWSPCLDKVGTYKAVKNSALAINKYSKNKFKVLSLMLVVNGMMKKNFLSKIISKCYKFKF
jgi:hypothetical protein